MKAKINITLNHIVWTAQDIKEKALNQILIGLAFVSPVIALILESL